MLTVIRLSLRVPPSHRPSHRPIPSHPLLLTGCRPLVALSPVNLVTHPLIFRGFWLPNAFQCCGQLPELPLPLGGSGPHLIHGPWTHYTIAAEEKSWKKVLILLWEILEPSWSLLVNIHIFINYVRLIFVYRMCVICTRYSRKLFRNMFANVGYFACHYAVLCYVIVW